MTANEFRRRALSLPESEEGSHMEHPDFRVGGKIFASLGADETWGMVKLTSEQQASFVGDAPDVFAPARGAWGRRGATIIQLRRANKMSVSQAFLLAWRNTAPKSILKKYDAD